MKMVVTTGETVLPHKEVVMGKTILALDIATTTGFAIGRADQPKPRFGTVHFGKTASDTEDKMAALMRWLLDIFQVEKPDFVVIERAMDPNLAVRLGNRSVTIEELIAMAKTAGALCRLAAIPFKYCDRQEALGFFTGQRTYKDEKDPRTGMVTKSRDVGKRATVRRCYQLGIEVQDDNQGDAVALWFWAAGQDNPRIAAAVTPLFAGSGS